MFKQTFINLLKNAGITVNGQKSWDMRVRSDEVYRQALRRGNLGLGETYMDMCWDCDRLDAFIYRLVSAGLDKRKYLTSALIFFKSWFINAQKITRARQVGERHYDLGNELYQSFLDSRMQYSCGYWLKADNLEQAQIDKLDLICRKLRLKAGETVLDIGCGWGGFAKYAAENYGVKVTGLTISVEQAKFAREFCRNLPVDILTADYREHRGKYDKIVSVGMFEHVGPKNYRTYMEVVNRCLKDDGIFLLHTIGGLVDSLNTDAWIEKYIFPNGVIPSMRQIIAATDGLLVNRDVHEFGHDYDKTLMAWWDRFNLAWPELNKHNSKYDKRFYRMWKYYLQSCAGAFRAEKLRLWQIVFTKPGVKSDYSEVR